MAFLQYEYMSAALTRSISVKIFLPTDFMGQVFQPPYKTLYFLPGYSASASQILTFLGLRKQSELKGMAIVIPDGENQFYHDLPERRAFYSRFIGEELVNETRKLLPLSDKREDTYIGGISMGGYGAMYNGVKYCDVFSKIAAFSPSVDPYDLMTGNDPAFTEEQFNHLFKGKEAYLESSSYLPNAWKNCDPSKLPELFMCCGEEDTLVVHTVNALEKFLKENNMPFIYEKGHGNHEYDYWNSQLDNAFSFLAGIERGTAARFELP
ncbi:MAG: prolyl oligopeptidase family serine peptidase [Parasporobacterium sp.]|nr:prolyl oligopeptidase family serine peptidase [Parasporobacterium sp.]